MLPRSVRNPVKTIERLKMLKTTVRWTFAHASLEEQERKHPIELSLWAINSLLVIENLGAPLSYADKVMALHQRLWVRLWLYGYRIKGFLIVHSLFHMDLCLKHPQPRVAPWKPNSYAIYQVCGMT